MVPRIANGAGNGAVKTQWEKYEVQNKWDSSAWAQGRAKSGRRRELSDFERFKVLRLRKQVCV